MGLQTTQQSPDFECTAPKPVLGFCLTGRRASSLYQMVFSQQVD